jgi:selenocysteine lyase/cysteine desulfurase
MDQFDQLRQTEFSRLDKENQVYFDYTGAGLYAESQVRAHADLMLRDTFGNPHSSNPTSLHSTEFVEKARRRILDFFDADPDEYEAIFTLNASGALKLVGESFPFGPGSRYVLVSDNHNSVNGIREFAASKGAQVKYAQLNRGLHVENIEAELAGIDTSKANLFAFPAQSNFTGVKHPLEWVVLAKSMGYAVMLDAAAYVPTNRLSLRQVKPDFMSLSFYKMFGYPTGVGALVARHEALLKLHRPWFGGGTVRFVSAQNQTHLLRANGEAFEDGTLNFLSIAAIPIGLDFLESVGMDSISAHVRRLTVAVIDGLTSLRHSNGKPVIEMYGPLTTEHRGGTVSFNIMTPEGKEVESSLVERLANEHNISLRTGCFCNPGAAEAAFHYSQIEAYQCFDGIDPVKFTLQQFATCMNSPVGAVRVSVGIATNDSDIRKLMEFMETFVDFEPELSERTLPEVVGGS